MFTEGREPTHDGLGGHEMRAIRVVEIYDTLSGELKMLALVLSYWNMSSSGSLLANV